MKILVVDDSQIMRRILKVGIGKINKDAVILEAENGQEALEILRNNPDIAYTFLDINMPIMRGDEMLKIVRNDPELKHHKIIIQTTEGRKEKFIEIKNMGISGYIIKPYTQQIVENMMQKIMEKEGEPA
ncbi:MAG: response regulator [Epsilonproteobacteria bacterium]|nr:response regulator [Campylobacterota bacterium]